VREDKLASAIEKPVNSFSFNRAEKRMPGEEAAGFEPLTFNL